MGRNILMDQTVFNWVFGIATTSLGFLAHTIWSSIRDMQRAQSRLQTRLSEVEVLVAGSYVKRQEFERFVDRVIDKLDAIDAKIDGKADK